MLYSWCRVFELKSLVVVVSDLPIFRLFSNIFYVHKFHLAGSGCDGLQSQVAAIHLLSRTNYLQNNLAEQVFQQTRYFMESFRINRLRCLEACCRELLTYSV